MIILTDRRRAPFQIDEADHEAVSRYSWHLDGSGYVATCVGKRPDVKTISLQRFLLGPAPDGLEWDHKNRDRRDNRRDNLRAVSGSVNMRNTSMKKSNKTGVRGVHWDKGIGRYKAQIQTGNGLKYLGVFTTLDQAASVRRDAERELWGDAR